MESYTNISNSLIEDENLSHTEFRVMMTLIRYYNTDLGYSFPTRELLVKKCRMNKDTLGRVLNSLEEKGYITRSKREGKAGRNNIYYINKYLVGQETSSQASTEPKPNNKSRNKKKQATEPQEDLDYKLGYIESSLEFARDFRDTELAELKEVDMKIIERVCEEMRGETDISPFVFLLDLQKCKRGINWWKLKNKYTKIQEKW